MTQNGSQMRPSVHMWGTCLSHYLGSPPREENQAREVEETLYLPYKKNPSE